MQKKLISVFLSIILICTALTGISFSESYWDVYDDYIQALDSNDSDRIISCVQRIEAVYPSPNSESEYTRLAYSTERAAQEYEKQSKYTQACQYYKKSLDCFIWLNENGIDYIDKIKLLEGIIAHTEGIFEVYTESDISSDAPYFSQINEPESGFGTYYGMCSDYINGNQSAKLIYVQFFTEDIGWFDWQLPPNKNDLIEIAWNVPNETYEDLEQVCMKETEEYIKRNVEWLASQDYKFIIRFGAEVNCWKDLDNYPLESQKEQYTKIFKQAFAKVANFVHNYAPNCAMMYSPNDISNWYYTAEDFYPGDEYVDWIGMSTYCNVSGAASGEIGNQSDAWYSRGVYENQLIRIKNIIDIFKDRKPIAISECGFAYSDPSGIQNIEHATKALKYFYTYVNMVYPQVKAVFYFNTDFNGTCFSLNGNQSMYDTYVRTVNQNVSMQKTTQTTGQNYIKLANLNENTNQISLYTCLYYPGVQGNISYELDGEMIYSSSSYPYKCIIPRPSEGFHTLTVTAKAGNTVNTKNYAVTVTSDGNIEVTESKMVDVLPDSWAFEAVSYVVKRGMFNGMTENTFEPKTNLNRAMLVTVVARLEGVEENRYCSTKFTDVKTGKYYTGYVKWASDIGIINGINPNEFAPEQFITRQQTAAILFRYATYKGFDTSQRNNLNGYIDQNEISDYAVSAMEWANSIGLINGRTPVELEPKGFATRAEIAKIMMMFDKVYY